MGISEIWWLDLWATVAIFMAGLGLFFAFIGMCMVAVEGRKGWDDGVTFGVVGIPLAGILFPFIILALPIIAIYRAIRNK